ncbi:hypothetical protein EAI_04935, partial [Harpegnathos saltator]
GRVLLYIDKIIKFDIVSIETCDKNWWAITVKIKDKNYIGMIMIVYYLSNSKDTSFIAYLEETCIGSMQNDNVIKMSDFNIDRKVNNHTQNKL